jgi:hypothetical protein
MNKSLLTSAMAIGAIINVVPVLAVEVDISPSGFVDMRWTLSDGTDLGINGAEQRFDTSGELDVESAFQKGVSMRLDADLNPASSSHDSGSLEQVFLKWDINQQLSLKGGVFNNNLTFEKEDAPDLYQITHGQLWDIWNVSTAEYGNNLQGVELGYSVDKLDLMVGILNDLGDTPEKNSFKFAAGIRATKDLNITAGLITQDQNFETLIDAAITYQADKLLLAGELLLADQVIDNGIMLMANFAINKEFSLTGRFDTVSYDVAGADNTTSFTFAGNYSISENLLTRFELRSNSDDNVPAASAAANLGIGEGDGTTARLELLAKF